MFVKPSYSGLLSNILLAGVASVSLTACGSTDITSPSSWWKDLNNEREPQVVNGPRRAPTLNKDFVGEAPVITEASPQAAIPAARAANNSEPVEFSRGSNAYDRAGNSDADKPYWIESVGSWFMSQVDSDPTPSVANYQPIEHSAIAAQTVEAINTPMPLAFNTPPTPQRKPIANNANASVVKEGELLLAEVKHPPSAIKKPRVENIDETDRLLAQLEKESSLVAPASSFNLASARGSEPSPWGERAPLNTPTPPTTPARLSALIPANGMRKESAELVVEEVSEDTFEAMVAASEQPPQEINAGVGGPLFSNEREATEEIVLAAASAEYPPLNSVPPVPKTFEEAARGHPAVKEELETERYQSNQSREAVRQQMQEEAADSLMPKAPYVPEPQSLSQSSLILPPSQFTDDKWVRPTLANTEDLLPFIHPSKRPVAGDVAFNPEQYAEIQPASGEDAQSVIDGQFAGEKIAAKEVVESEIKTAAPMPMATAPAPLQKAEAPKKTSKPSIEMAASSPNTVGVDKVSTEASFRDAAADAYRMSKIKREVVGVFSVLPNYVYMPVLNEKREVVYFADSPYLNYR